MFSDACRVWNGMERRGLERGAAAYEEMVVTLFKNNRVSDAMKVFDGMRRRGASDGGKDGCYRVVVSWLCKEGRMWGTYIMFPKMVKRGVEVDREVIGDMVCPMARRRVREGYKADARFLLSWRPVHRLLEHLTAVHGFVHSPATAARFVDVLAKSRNIELLHSTLLSLPLGICSLAAIRVLAPAREVGKVSALVTLFSESDRPRTLTFIADVVCSVRKLPDVAEKVIKQAERR
ncbi:hypothetical protein E2562_034701 [Oryza meyeriana var. granulata]|uniref:Uncharacterized protein n=1 Tax=Oryza meyeriana var. granulata TaxID=110450 RepID=A0A6G1C3I4_9ORYZ|nr:hypothetical protein E2562_034701 [Oryza meyeriana var. granulata]